LSGEGKSAYPGQKPRRLSRQISTEKGTVVWIWNKIELSDPGYPGLY